MNKKALPRLPGTLFRNLCSRLSNPNTLSMCEDRSQIIKKYFHDSGTAVQSKGATFERKVLKFVRKMICLGAFGFIPEQTRVERGVYVTLDSMDVSIQADILIKVSPPWYKPMYILVECKDTIAPPGIAQVSQLAWKVSHLPAIGGILITTTLPSKRGFKAAQHDNIAIVHYDKITNTFKLLE